MRLRTCFRWNPKTRGHMFRGERRSFREHLTESRAAVATWQVDFKKGHTKECRKGKFSCHTRRFNHVQLAFPGLVKRGDSFDRMCELMHQLDQLNVCDKFAAMLKNDVRTSDPRCDHGLQCQHVVHHALTIIPRFTGVLARRRLESGCAGGFPLFFSSLPSRYRRWQGYWWNGCRLRTSEK